MKALAIPKSRLWGCVSAGLYLCLWRFRTGILDRWVVNNRQILVKHKDLPASSIPSLRFALAKAFYDLPIEQRLLLAQEVDKLIICDVGLPIYFGKLKLLKLAVEDRDIPDLRAETAAFLKTTVKWFERGSMVGTWGS